MTVPPAAICGGSLACLCAIRHVSLCQCHDRAVMSVSCQCVAIYGLSYYGLSGPTQPASDVRLGCHPPPLDSGLSHAKCEVAEIIGGDVDVWRSATRTSRALAFGIFVTSRSSIAELAVRPRQAGERHALRVRLPSVPTTFGELASKGSPNAPPLRSTVALAARITRAHSTFGDGRSPRLRWLRPSTRRRGVGKMYYVVLVIAKTKGNLCRRPAAGRARLDARLLNEMMFMKLAMSKSRPRSVAGYSML